MAHPLSPPASSPSQARQLGYIPRGLVGARVQQLNTIADRLADQRDTVRPCSSNCPRIRLEFSSSPPIGHAYDGVRLSESHALGHGSSAWQALGPRMARPARDIRPSKSATPIGRPPAKTLLRHSRTLGSVGEDEPEFPPFIRHHIRHHHSSPAGSQLKTPLPAQPTTPQRSTLEALDRWGNDGSMRSDCGAPHRGHRPAPQTRTIHICHSCGEALRSGKQCAKCGHEFCVKCTSKIVEDEDVGTAQADAIQNPPACSRRPLVGGSQVSTADTPQGSAKCASNQHLEKPKDNAPASGCCESKCPTCHVSKHPSRHCLSCAAQRSLARRRAREEAEAHSIYNGSPSCRAATARMGRERLLQKLKAGNDFRGASASSLLSGYVTSAEASRAQSLCGDEGARTTCEADETAAGQHAAAESVPTNGPHDLAADTPVKVPAQRRMHDLADDAMMRQHPVSQGHDINDDIVFQKPVSQGHDINDDIVFKKPRREPLGTAKGEGLDGVESTQKDFASDPGRRPKTMGDRNPTTPTRSSEAAWSQTPPRKAGHTHRSPPRGADPADLTAWMQRLRKTSRGKGGTPGAQTPQSSPKVAHRHGGSSEVCGKCISGWSPRPKTKEQSGPRGVADGSAKQAKAGQGLKQKDQKSPTTSSVSSKNKPRASSGQHRCEWRSRYQDLTSELEKMKTELSALEDPGHEGEGDEAAAPVSPDSEIEGLTVIVHRRYREDIVLNTDLRGKGKEKASK